MMFRGRREYINLTQSTAYTIVSVVTAHTRSVQKVSDFFV